MPGHKHPFSAAPHRDQPPREAPSLAWACALSRHVEPRLVCGYSAAAFAVIAALMCVAIALAIAGGAL